NPLGWSCSPVGSTPGECSPCGVRAQANDSPLRCGNTSTKSAPSKCPSRAVNPTSSGSRGREQPRRAAGSRFLRRCLELFLGVPNLVQCLRVDHVGDRTACILVAVVTRCFAPAGGPDPELFAE